LPIKIPRAEETIARTVASLRVAVFPQDPLMSMDESFLVSIWNSVVRRDGAVIESAIMDCVAQTPKLRLLPVICVGSRKVDVQFEVIAKRQIVALEIKRGSLHDSTKIRQFQKDLIEMPEILQRCLPVGSAAICFHIVFVSGTPPIAEGLTVANLKKLYGLDAVLHIDRARRRFADAVRAVIKERT
jgi:hypothetical protein